MPGTRGERVMLLGGVYSFLPNNRNTTNNWRRSRAEEDGSICPVKSPPPRI